MQAFRYFIFDLDGTLVDSLPGIAWSIDAAFAGCGLPRPSGDLQHHIGPPVRTILAALCETSDDAALNQLEQSFRHSYDSQGWRMTACRQGVRELLSDLQARGAQLFIVTNKPEPATHKILGELGLFAFFQEVACRETQNSKAEVLSALLERRRLDRAACLMVGDTQEDSNAAAAAGIACKIVSNDFTQGITI